MGALANIMNAIKTQLAAAYPGRVVTRDLLDFNDRAEADLVKGVYTIVSTGEGDYADYRGREAQLGTLDLVIVGQIKVAEKAAASAAPHEIEDAEFGMIEDIKAFCAGALAQPISELYLKSWNQSGQLEYPYGWVSMKMEVGT